MKYSLFIVGRLSRMSGKMQPAYNSPCSLLSFPQKPWFGAKISIVPLSSRTLIPVATI